MYAVIKAGGKQQKVKAGDVIEVELVHGGPGDEVTFTPLLVVDDDGKTHFGKEAAKAVVKAKLVGEQKGDKVKVFKYRPKTGYAKTQGHRQMHTLVEILDVSLGRRAASRSAKKEEAAAEEPAEAEATPESKTEAGAEQPAEAEAAASEATAEE